MATKNNATEYVIQKLNNANRELNDILDNTDHDTLSDEIESIVIAIENILKRLYLSGYKFYKFKVFHNRNTLKYEYVKTQWLYDSFESEDEFIKCLLIDEVIDEDTATFTCEITEVDEDEYVTATCEEEPIVIHDFREVK